ncbi:hypothetical protein CRYUN_Cryun03dG0130900 [Craigia yunnanensis]
MGWLIKRGLRTRRLGKDQHVDDVVKPYTPTTLDSDLGYLELVIKMYPQGRMSHHFREMREGDYLAVKGPKISFFDAILHYVTNPIFLFPCWKPVVDPYVKNKGASSINLAKLEHLVARAIFENPNDMTSIHLIYANVAYEDILLKNELDELSSKFPNRMSVYCVLNQGVKNLYLWLHAVSNLQLMFSMLKYHVQPTEGWDGGVGFISKEMIQAHCPAPAQDIQMLRCGPPHMNKAMAAHLEALGFSSEMQFQF